MCMFSSCAFSTTSMQYQLLYIQQNPKRNSLIIFVYHSRQKAGINSHCYFNNNSSLLSCITTFFFSFSVEGTQQRKNYGTIDDTLRQCPYIPISIVAPTKKTSVLIIIKFYLKQRNQIILNPFFYLFCCHLFQDLSKVSIQLEWICFCSATLKKKKLFILNNT